MKDDPKRNILKKWKSASVVGFGMTGIGLVCSAMIIGQLLPAILNGQTPGVSTVEMALEATVALIFLISGFALMVIGSDPFEDPSSGFRVENDRDEE